MRIKHKKFIVTFNTTSDAMAMESYCRKHSLPGRLIPVPREISAGCGMCWCAQPEERALLEGKIKSGGLAMDSFYEIMI